MWVEINGRVNYPIKTVLVQMEQNNEFNLNCDHVKYCVSWFTQHVAHVGTTMFVKAWNDHRIPGNCVRVKPALFNHVLILLHVHDQATST